MSIHIERLNFSYPKSSTIIKLEELKVETHERVFLHGKSGSGKTTLLSLIAGILPCQEGKISIQGNSLSEISSYQIDSFRGKNLGFIFQNFNLIPYLSVLENILLPAKLQGRAKQLEARANQLIKELNIQSRIDTKASQLSVGQQQRVAAARALLLEPPLIIADEPTSSLDEENVDEFMKLLLKQWNQKPFTLLFVSHDQRLQKYFDRSINLLEINKAVTP